MLSRNETLWLFDRASTDTASWFRFFVREVADDYAWGLSLADDETLRTYVRRAIRSGELVAVRPGPPRERPVSMQAPAAEAVAPDPVPTARPPRAVRPPEPALVEKTEFAFPDAQCDVLVAAAEAGLPFCEECACARARQQAA